MLLFIIIVIIFIIIINIIIGIINNLFFLSLSLGGKPVEDVKITLPFPKSVLSVNLSPSFGKFSFDEGTKVFFFFFFFFFFIFLLLFFFFFGSFLKYIFNSKQIFYFISPIPFPPLYPLTLLFFLHYYHQQ